MGPRIVALGGGHGLSTLLRGLKSHPCDLTAIVTVADDGGSSGVLREELGMLPPGDLRDCIVALADAEPLMMRLFQYRFGRGGGLGGHSFGNLFIAALAGITGDFESAIGGASRVLAVRGRIVPSTLQNVSLCAEVRIGDELQLVCGQSHIAEAGGAVERVFLQPDVVRGHPAAVSALLHADLIVLGPGSLYTSILPNLLVPEIADAIRASSAVKVYVCNVATQPGETGHYAVSDHVQALCEHLGPDLCECVLANSAVRAAVPLAPGSEMVQPDPERITHTLVLEDLVDAALPWRHDPGRLAEALLRIYSSQRTEAAAPRPPAHGLAAAGSCDEPAV
ncbi:MAG: gluconeogenesis factor YvcK family protein [Anaerolineae bacterium]